MIINTSESTSINIQVTDESYCYKKIKGENSLYLTFLVPEYIELPIGSFIDLNGTRYKLQLPATVKKIHSRYFEIQAKFSSGIDELSKYRFKDTLTNKLKFSLTARPQEHLQFLIDNLNLRDSGWTVGQYLDATEKVISYNFNTCAEALNMIADAFETEWEIIGKQISIYKAEHNRSNPIPLQYGKGNGFRSGVGRNSDKMAIERLWVQGGNRNIDWSKYPEDSEVKSDVLLLPKNKLYYHHGIPYRSDEDGFSVHREDKPYNSYAEDSLDLSNIYPKKEGAVTAVTVVNLDKHFYDFTDQNNNVDYNEYLMEGQKLTVEFQTGMLTGKTLDVNYKHSTKTFEIVPTEIDGRTMPDEQYKPQIGDTYAIFGMMLPQEYICNDANQTGASWEMMKEACRYLYDNGETKFTFTGELDPIYAKQNWDDISPRLMLGGCVQFADPQFQPQGINIRIVGIKQLINDPHRPTLELSNDTVGQSFSSQINQIWSDEQLAEKMNADMIQMFYRGWRQIKETTSMLEELALDGFTTGLNPITVQTMQLIIGDERLQYEFYDFINHTVVTHTPTFNVATKVLTMPAGTIKHYTKGITAIANQHAETEYQYKQIAQATFDLSEYPNKHYYIYIDWTATGVGNFILSETPVNADTYYLCYLIGKEINNERAITRMYGFTEILPGQITTDIIRSADGNTYFDLVNNIVKGRFDFRDGLISSMIVLASQTNGAVTAGLQGDSSVNVGAWFGGTYQEALDNIAKIILNKDGTGKIGIFNVLEDSIEVQTADGGKMIYDEDGIRLQDENGKNTVEIYEGEIPDLSNIIINKDITVPLNTRDSTQNLQSGIYSVLNGSDFDITKPNNSIAFNLVGQLICRDSTYDNSNKLYFKVFIKSSQNQYYEVGNAIANTSGNNSGTITNINLNCNISNLPVDSYQICFQGIYSDYIFPGGLVYMIRWGWNIPTFDVNIIEEEQRTVIGKNGIASIWSNNEYFFCQKPINGNPMRLQIRSSDFELYTDGGTTKMTLPNLATSQIGLASKQLYNDNGTIKQVP